MKANKYAFREDPYGGSYEISIPKTDGERLLLACFRRRRKDGYYLFEILNESGESLLLNGKLDSDVNKRKLISTACDILVCFIKKSPDVIVVVESDAEKYIRFIHMGIWLAWWKISPCLEVKGFYKNRWNSFRKELTYTSFRFRSYPVNLSRIC